MSYVTLRGWCVILNVHAPTEDRTDNEELEPVFNQWPKYHKKIMFRDFKAKVGKADIFKPTVGNGSLHENSINNGVKVVNFATSKNLIVKSTVSHIAAFINTLVFS
jgi:hypothetical protein